MLPHGLSGTYATRRRELCCVQIATVITKILLFMFGTVLLYQVVYEHGTKPEISVGTRRKQEGSAVSLFVNATYWNIPCEFLVPEHKSVFHYQALAQQPSWSKVDIKSRINTTFTRNYNAKPVVDTNAKTQDVLGNDLFLRYVSEYNLALVAFMQPTCSWCKRLEPVWRMLGDRIPEEFGGDTIVLAVDCSSRANIELCAAHQIAAFPTIMAFVNHDATNGVRYGAHKTRGLQNLIEFGRDVKRSNFAHDHVVGDSVLWDNQHTLNVVAGGCNIAGYVPLRESGGSIEFSVYHDQFSVHSSLQNFSVTYHNITVLQPMETSGCNMFDTVYEIGETNTSTDFVITTRGAYPVMAISLVHVQSRPCTTGSPASPSQDFVVFAVSTDVVASVTQDAKGGIVYKFEPIELTIDGSIHIQLLIAECILCLAVIVPILAKVEAMISTQIREKLQNKIK